MTEALRRIGALARLVKIEHSIFALPFSFIGFFLAARGWPGFVPFALLVVAMVGVRSFAMGVNRLADLRFDRVNPRTQNRELVTGEVGVGEAAAFCCLCAAVFVPACAGLNSLCLKLAPVALVWAGFYSFSKRFTWLCHFFLGSVLGMAPVGGWLAVSPEFTLPAVLFGLGVTFWTAGFDILYACQDKDFDRERGLCSIPARFGLRAALGMSSLSHVVAVVFFALAGWAAGLGWIYFLFFGAAAVVLLWEHLILSEDDMSRVDTAFFTMNGLAAVGLGLGAVLDVFV